MTTQTSLYVAIPKLPDFGAVGGNARHADFWTRKRAYEKERDAWKVALRSIQAPQFDHGAFFNGPVELRAVLHFQTAQKRDYENAIYAMKCLIDLFEPFRAEIQTAKSGKRYEVTKGMLGWIADDSLIEWPWLVTKEVRSQRAPLTEIELRAVGHEQRSLV